MKLRNMTVKTILKVAAGSILLVGIYAAFFCIASFKYEKRVAVIGNRVNDILFLLGTSERNTAISEIPQTQRMPSPCKPRLLDPLATLGSLFGESQTHAESVRTLKAMVEAMKREMHGVSMAEADLSGADLSYADFSDSALSGVDFSGANLESASMKNANLEKTVFFKATLRFVDLNGSRLAGADLRMADMHNACVSNASLEGADLTGADLSGADLSHSILTGTKGLGVEQLSNARTLYGAELETEISGWLKKKYPGLFEKPASFPQVLPHKAECYAMVFLPWALGF